MATSFNPFPVRQFSKHQVEMLFGPKSDAKLAQQTKSENPNLYAAIRAQAVADGLVGNVPVPYAAWRMPKDRVFTDAEISVRAKYSEQECRALFCQPNTSSATNAGNLFKTDPHKYAEMRQAAVSFGLVPEGQPAPVVHTDKPRQDDGGVTLSDENADRLNLPRNTRVTAEQYTKIVALLNPETVSVADTKES